MHVMLFGPLVLSLSISAAQAAAGAEKARALPSFDYEATATHEIKPHQHTIPHVKVWRVDSINFI